MSMRSLASLEYDSLSWAILSNLFLPVALGYFKGINLKVLNHAKKCQ
jgi:hypothetical protein